MQHNHRDHEGAQKLYSLIKDVKICMMTTVEPDGSLHSRPMWNQDADEAGDLWFFTRISSPKVSEISKDGQVNLGYSDPSKNDYVSVSGRAEIVRDKAHDRREVERAAQGLVPGRQGRPADRPDPRPSRQGRVLGKPVLDHRAALRLRQGDPDRLLADRDDRPEEGQPALTRRPRDAD